ncbi:MAG: M20 aminoacylase family protein [Pseudomonas sp.]|jgi:hippurate hydrolase|uniref:M20 aminoacylase family protein n=1 Tax=Pseudomonas sp. TaxID=306 RepID=UPI00356772F6
MKTEPHYCKVDDLRPQTEELTRIRRHIHQHPEMAYEEFQTAKLVAERLRAWGFSVTEGVGETGVVGSLTVGAGKNIGIRADMDALPLTEQTGLPYASVHQGKMHACGHDGHTTMLLGAAEYLARTRNFRGTVHLYFQPAEEKGFDSGAQRMVNDGLFERFPCDAVFGMHNHPGEAPGTFLFRSGPFMSASDKVAITIHGLGGHAARPHLTVDPVVVASSIVMSLQTIVARNINPVEPAVVTAGLLQAGVANNVISSSAYLELSIRSFSKRVRSLLKERIEALVHAQANSYGATATIDYMEGYPVIDNDRAQTEFALQVARELVGDEHVIAHADQLMSSEDFAYMLEQRPGCFLRLGNGVGEDGCMVHNPAYDFNDKNLPIGAAYWARLVERYLN